MAEDVAAWLQGLGLGKYAEVFADNEIGFTALPHLSEDDLKELGLPMGPRKVVLDALSRLPSSGPATPEAAPPARAAAPADAERRQLTVMFCDLVGSTALSQRLDPEDLRDLMRRYQDAVAGAVSRHAGYLAKYLGDGVLVYFGWPEAHEDQAESGLRAGLDAVEAVAGVTLDGGEPLAARVGIATGEVVIGDIVGTESAQAEAVVGETPNLAARLQEVAAAGQVVIDHATRRLVGAGFELEDLGGHDLKGFADAVAVWRVEGERATESRFAAARGRNGSIFVGREDELALLSRRWERAKAGQGQVALISGEPGIGKSRLGESFNQRLEDERFIRLRYQCSPLHTNSAFYPFVQQLSRAGGLAPGDTPAQALGKLEALFADTADDVAETAATMAVMMSIPLDNGAAPEGLSPQQHKQRIFEALFAQLAATSRERPVLAIFEDLHWIDPSSQELLEHTVGRLEDLPVLMLLTHRPEYEAPWVGEANVATITLNRLDARQSAALAADIAGAPLDRNLLDTIVARSDGVPLFVEELTKNIVEAESAGTPIAASAIPATLQDILTARLDRLGEARDIAQIGAVAGRTFSYALLAASALVPEAQLVAGLQELEGSGLIYRRGTVPDAVYSFKHALIQDAAYESLLKRRRRDLHGKIAETLVAQFPERAEQEPQLLAYHFAEAGEAARAAELWYKAGQQAQRQSAGPEAMAHYSQAIVSIQQLPEADAHALLELDCHIALGPLVMFTKGAAAPEVARHIERAVSLSDRIADDGKSYTVKWGKWYLEHFGAGDPEAAARTAEELLELGLRQNDRGKLLQAHHSAWTSRFAREDLQTTLEHVEAGLNLYDPDEHRHQITEFGGHDAGVCCRNVGALIYCLLGRLERGAQLADEAVATARYIEHGFSEIMARSFATTVHLLRRDEDKLIAAVEALEDRVGESAGSFVHFVFTPKMLKGWAYVKRGRVEEGLELLESSLAAIRKTGFPRLSFQLHVMADGRRRAGELDKALDFIAQAFDNGATTGERLWHAELHRVRGETLLAQDLPEDAEQAFDQALSVSRGQGATLFELRAATSMARLWLDQDKREAARDLLEPVHARFSEGLDRPDLVEAQALLGALEA